jgi:hypothetical protein
MPPIEPTPAGSGIDPPSAPMMYAISTTANVGVGCVPIATNALHRTKTSKPR